jgi:Family of unknown function (DUF5678)
MVITKEKFGKYEEQWVAITSDEEILDSAITFDILAKKMDKKKNKKKCTMMYIPSFKLYWVPSARHAQKI